MAELPKFEALELALPDTPLSDGVPVTGCQEDESLSLRSFLNPGSTEAPTAPTRVQVPQARVRARGTRRIVGGRPRARRTTSSATSRGDPALADEPPGHRPPSREGAVA